MFASHGHSDNDGGHLEVLVVPVVRPRGPRQLEPAGEGILQLALVLLSITLRTHHNYVTRHLVRALAAHSWPGVEGVLGGIRPGAQRTGAVRLAHRVTSAWEEIFLNYYTSNIICRIACNIRRTYESHNLPVVEVHAAKHVPRLQVHTK